VHFTQDTAVTFSKCDEQMHNYLESRSHFAYSLYSSSGATMTLKGRLFIYLFTSKIFTIRWFSIEKTKPSFGAKFDVSRA